MKAFNFQYVLKAVKSVSTQKSKKNSVFKVMLMYKFSIHNSHISMSKFGHCVTNIFREKNIFSK